MPAVFNQSSGISLGEGRNGEEGGGGKKEQRGSSPARYSAQQYCSQSPSGMYVRAPVLSEHSFSSRLQRTDKIRRTWAPPWPPQHPCSPPCTPSPPPHTSSQTISIGFRISSETQTWIFTPTKPPGSWGGEGAEVCVWLVAEGGGSWDAKFQPAFATVQDFGSLLLQSTAPCRTMSPQGWGTRQRRHPIGLRSWLSSRPFQKPPGTCARAPLCHPLRARFRRCGCRGAQQG